MKRCQQVSDPLPTLIIDPVLERWSRRKVSQKCVDRHGPLDQDKILALRSYWTGYVCQIRRHMYVPRKKSELLEWLGSECYGMTWFHFRNHPFLSDITYNRTTKTYSTSRPGYCEYSSCQYCNPVCEEQIDTSYFITINVWINMPMSIGSYNCTSGRCLPFLWREGPDRFYLPTLRRRRKCRSDIGIVSRLTTKIVSA